LRHCVCGAEPKAYKCHHCDELVFLSEDKLKANYAYCLNLNAPGPLAADSAAKRREEKEAAEHEILLAKLERDKEAVKSAGKKPKEKTADEKLKELEDEFAMDRVRFIGAADFVERHMRSLSRITPARLRK
jgi:hypothetical protein